MGGPPPGSRLRLRAGTGILLGVWASSLTEEQARGIERLLGRTVTSWVGIEMAILETGTDGAPVFEDDRVPCLQLMRLTATLDTDETFAFVTAQNETEFGLWRVPDSQAFATDDPQSIYRQRVLVDLPTGDITKTSIRSSEAGDIAEVELHFGDSALLLIAGEVWEERGDALSFHRFDESVLAFTDPSAADRINWIPPRA